MENYIKENLQNSERILWTGKPAKIQLLEAAYKKGIFLRWAFCAVLIAICAWYPGYAVASSIPASRVQSVIIFLSVVAVITGLGPLYTIWKIQNKTLYCITNQRAITCYKANPIKMKFRVLEDVSEVTYETLPTGNGTVYIGTKTKETAKQARFQPMLDNSHQADPSMPLMFYSIENPQAVCELIPQKLSSGMEADIAGNSVA